jgi:hypothetical protein
MAKHSAVKRGGFDQGGTFIFVIIFLVVMLILTVAGVVPKTFWTE